MKCPPQAYKIIVGNGLDRSETLKLLPITGIRFQGNGTVKTVPYILF